MITIPESALIDIEDIDKYEPGQICVISTGSQGEPMSALALLARGENKFVKLGDHDTVILSSHAIPGNESNVNRVDRRAAARRCRGHPLRHRRRARHRPRPGRRDQDLPVDRATRVLRARSTASTATWSPTPGSGGLMGVAHDHVLLCEDGDVLELTDDGLDRGRTCARRLPVRRRHRRRRRPGRAPRPPRARRGRRGRGRRHGRHRRPARC